jgi:hypothetical protein
MLNPLNAFVTTVTILIATALGVVVTMFLQAYFTGAFVIDGIPLRKKWSKTWRMKRFLGLE